MMNLPLLLNLSLMRPKLGNKGISMLYRIFCILGVLAFTGCASTTGTFFSRPVVEDNIKNVLSTVSLSADRRTVVVSTFGENMGKFCAEPPPDAATGLKTELDASLEAKIRSEKLKAEAEGKFDISDKFQTTVVVLAERTAALDAYRTGVYALCQYHLNGAISGAELKSLFEKLIQSYETLNGVPKKVGT